MSLSCALGGRAATATAASYFAFADGVVSWLAGHGVPQAKARDYVGRIFGELGNTAMNAPERSFKALASDHATLGGINEQMLAHPENQGVFETLSDALDAVMRRITSAA